jgi:hypothetical protein
MASSSSTTRPFTSHGAIHIPGASFAVRRGAALIAAVLLCSTLVNADASAASWERGARPYQGFIAFGIGNERGSRFSIECDSDGTNDGFGGITFMTRGRQRAPSDTVRVTIIDMRSNAEVAAFSGNVNAGDRSGLNVSISLGDETTKFRNLLRYLGRATSFGVSIAAMNLLDVFEVSGGWNIPTTQCKFPS